MDSSSLRFPSARTAFAVRRGVSSACPEEAITADHRCAELFARYAARGGVSNGDVVALRMRHVHRQPLSMLARWIVDREVICYGWCGTTWLPDFQFDARSSLPHPCVRRVVRELRGVYDDLEIADWFVRDNAFLDDRAPADVIGTRPEAVLDAARADRFISDC